MLALSLTCATSTFISSPDAKADGYANSNGSYRTNQGSLPDASQFFHGKRKAQIIDERMEINDLRRAPASVNRIIINSPPPAAAPGTVTQIGDGADNGTNPYFTTPDSSISSLAPANFGSQPNANISHANVGPLPNGRSTGVHSQVAQQVSGRLQQRLANQRTNPNGQAAQATSPLVYNTQPYTKPVVGSAAGSGMQVTTSAQGKLLSRLGKK